MLDSNERLAFLRLVQSQRTTTRESFLLALIFITQAIISTVLLLIGYHAFNAPGATWAIVSAILVLQPGIEQALVASAVRIAANIVGGVTGFAFGYFLGTGPVSLLAALALSVIICELLHLDLGLRSACVAAVIVITANDGHVVTSSFERLAAVLIGCLLAVAVQILVEITCRILGWRNSDRKETHSEG